MQERVVAQWAGDVCVCARLPARETVSVDEAAVVERTVLGADAVAVAACFENSGARGPGDRASSCLLARGRVCFRWAVGPGPCRRQSKFGR